MSIRRKNFRDLFAVTMVAALGICAVPDTVYAEQSGDKANRGPANVDREKYAPLTLGNKGT